MESVLQAINPRHQVRKANALVEARFNLTEAEQKLILIAVSMIGRNDVSFTRCKIRVEEVMRALGIEGHGKYDQLRDLARSLLGKKLFIRKEKSELEVTWVASCEYFNRQGMMELEFSDKLAPYLLQLREKYTGFALETALRLQGKYALRLYELVCQYKNVGYRKIEVEALRHILEIPQGSAYDDFGRFRNRILEPAKEQINAVTDLVMTYQPVKSGRRFDYIEFQIRMKHGSQLKQRGLKPAVAQCKAESDEGKGWKDEREFRRYQREIAKERMGQMSGAETQQLQDAFIEDLRRHEEANFKRYKERGWEDLCVKSAFELFQIERLLKPEERDYQRWVGQHSSDKFKAV